ncbi:MAG: sugar phosphate isomerase/epimerase [Chryseolinea sp.]
MKIRNLNKVESRRGFIKHVAAFGGAAWLAGNVANAIASPLNANAVPLNTNAIPGDWSKQMGLQLYTVRDLMLNDMEGTIAKVAEIGFKDIEPINYGTLSPKQYRDLFDKYGLRVPSTHGSATAGPDLEKQLEGFQTIGIKYTAIRPAPGANRPAGAQGGSAASATPRPAPPPATAESVKMTAQRHNENGKIAGKFGMKILVHNGTGEFELLADGKQTVYDVLLAETDPSLVAMELDITWASIAGQNIVELIKKHPGRFELWHASDATGMKNLDPKLTPNQRKPLCSLVPIGLGEIDYKSIFAHAETAGLRHYYVEQDNAAAWGDAMAATRTNFQGMTRVLTS